MTARRAAPRWAALLCAAAAATCVGAQDALVRGAPGSFCDEPGYVRVFTEEFDAWNATRWTKTLGQNGGQLRDAWGTEDNVYIQAGHLVLRSQRQRAVDPASGKAYNFTSGAVTTQGSDYWTHGRVCVRAALPGVTKPGGSDGIWPAHWMMPNDRSCWPDHGEIDIMEMINGDGVSHGTYHWDRGYPAKPCTGQTGNTAIGNSTQMPADWDTAMHEYAVEWDGRSFLAFYVDARLQINITLDSTDKQHGTHPQFSGAPFYAILNTAIGGPWPKPVTPQTVFPAYHSIDSVHVSQRAA